MARPKSAHPTELELQILKLLWERSPMTVREVREGLAATGRELAHTSVITTLNAMTRKKYLRRSMQGNACLFAPRLGRLEASQRMLADVVERVFDGSAKAVMLSLFDCAALNAADLNELRQLINQKTREQSQ
ncbi:MAG: BlaI/MecI/CopY family transcriptional regulator [Planctomycetia bacterium]|nr:BlaI/MecI/CopY family transcriptional regulator [Planctomycetia bacterium]